MSDYEVFEPFERLIKINILGEAERVPERNSILRCLQFLHMDGISRGEFCWNGDCLNCKVWIRNGDKEKAVIACRTDAADGMEIVAAHDEILNSIASR